MALSLSDWDVRLLHEIDTIDEIKCFLLTDLYLA